MLQCTLAIRARKQRDSTRAANKSSRLPLLHSTSLQLPPVTALPNVSTPPCFNHIAIYLAIPAKAPLGRKTSYLALPGVFRFALLKQTKHPTLTANYGQTPIAYEKRNPVA